MPLSIKDAVLQAQKEESRKRKNAPPSTSASSTANKNSKADLNFTQLSMKDFQWVEDLGSGSYGTVSLVNLHG